SLLMLVAGMVLADVAFSLIVSGAAVAIGYAAVMVAFAWLLGRERKDALTDTLVTLGLGGHLLLALTHALAVDAPPLALVDGGAIDLVVAVFVLASMSAALFTSARLVSERHMEWRYGLDSLGLVVVAYTAVLVFDGAMLVAALAAQAVVLAWLAR